MSDFEQSTEKRAPLSSTIRVMDEAMPAQQSTEHDVETRELEVEVSMNALEYTLLELKNFLLSVLSLGVYSAWAKVQRRKYIAQHTKLDGHHFDFVAKPLVILRSRLLVVAILAASTLSEELHPSLKLVGFLSMILVFPWALTASTAFNARQTLYRGHPFLFSGKVKDAYIATFKSYGLSIITLGVGQLVSFQLFSSFFGNNTKLAGRSFSFDQPRKMYFELGGTAMVGCLILFGALSLLKFVVKTALGMETASLEAGPQMWLELGFMLASLAGYVFVAGAVRASLVNFFFLGLGYGPHTMISDLKPRTLGSMYLTNAAAIVCTLGLAIPWAYMRCYKYRMSCITVLAKGPLMDASVPKTPSGDGESDAIGDAFLDVGFDFGV